MPESVTIVHGGHRATVRAKPRRPSPIRVHLRPFAFICVESCLLWRQPFWPPREFWKSPQHARICQLRSAKRNKIGNAQWFRRTSRHWMDFLAETLWLKLLLSGLRVKALLCDAANPPMVGGQQIRPVPPRHSNAIALTGSTDLPRHRGTTPRSTHLEPAAAVTLPGARAVTPPAPGARARPYAATTFATASGDCTTSAS